MADKATKLPNDWVRCQSKSRPNRYYLFNKKTGETDWCLDTGDNVQVKTVSAKNVLKTPAQDRIKRLQNQLQKKRLNDEAAESSKSGGRMKRQAAKEKSKSPSPAPTTVNTSTPVVSDRRVTRKSPSPTDNKSAVIVNKPNTIPKKATKAATNDAKNLPSTTKSSTVQKRLINVVKKSPQKPANEKSNAETNKIKKAVEDSPGRYKNKTRPSLPVSKSSINTKSGRVTKERKARSVSPKILHQSGRKSPQKSTIVVEDESSSDTMIAVRYDENENERQSNQKSGFLSKIKLFCNNFLNGTTNTIKQRQTDWKDREKLSANSKPLFKNKKPGNKNLLRGILYETGSESLDNQKLELIYGKAPVSTSKVSHLIRVPNESANERLERLRKSLQQQQSLQTTSPISCFFSFRNDTEDDGSSTRNESECEPMDWQPIADDYKDPLNSPSTSSGISADLSTLSEYNEMVSENIMRLAAAKKQSKDWKRDHFYFVIDTNVFIQNPTFVEELTTMKLCDTMGTVIHIPYCVLQELDKLKVRSPSESIRIRTVRAIKFLNKAFEERHPLFQAQSAADERIHLIKVTSPDDSILNCCLQVKQHIDNLLLLTEDVNLQSKAMCNDILVSTKSDLISLH